MDVQPCLVQPRPPAVKVEWGAARGRAVNGGPGRPAEGSRGAPGPRRLCGRPRPRDAYPAAAMSATPWRRTSPGRTPASPSARCPPTQSGAGSRASCRARCRRAAQCRGAGRQLPAPALCRLRATCTPYRTRSARRFVRRAPYEAPQIENDFEVVFGRVKAPIAAIAAVGLPRRGRNRREAVGKGRKGGPAGGGRRRSRAQGAAISRAGGGDLARRGRRAEQAVPRKSSSREVPDGRGKGEGHAPFRSPACPSGRAWPCPRRGGAGRGAEGNV